VRNSEPNPRTQEMEVATTNSAVIASMLAIDKIYLN